MAITPQKHDVRFVVQREEDVNQFRQLFFQFNSSYRVDGPVLLSPASNLTGLRISQDYGSMQIFHRGKNTASPAQIISAYPFFTLRLGARSYVLSLPEQLRTQCKDLQEKLDSKSELYLLSITKDKIAYR